MAKTQTFKPGQPGKWVTSMAKQMQTKKSIRAAVKAIKLSNSQSPSNSNDLSLE